MLLGHIFSFVNVPIASNNKKISSHTQSCLLVECGRFLVMHTQTSPFFLVDHVLFFSRIHSENPV